MLVGARISIHVPLTMWVIWGTTNIKHHVKRISLSMPATYCFAKVGVLFPVKLTGRICAS